MLRHKGFHSIISKIQWFGAKDVKVENYTFKTLDKITQEIKYPNCPLQYFAGSIIEKSDETGTTHNDLRLFTETEDEADLEVPRESIIYDLKAFSDEDSKLNNNPHVEVHNGPKMLYCITMYQEDWGQILQSIAGCIRSIIECHREGE